MRFRTRILTWITILLFSLMGPQMAEGALNLQTAVEPGKVQISGSTGPGRLVALVITETGNNNRLYLEQIRADSSGDFNLIVPLGADSYTINAGSREDQAVNNFVVPVNPGSGGGGGGIQEQITLSLMVRGDSRAGVILPGSNLQVRRGSSALEVLKEALTVAGISYEINSNGYIKSIGGLKEKDRGSLSGWMFRVNGGFPQVGVGDYLVRDGDSLEFVYTCDGGKDVGDIGVNPPTEIRNESLQEPNEVVEKPPAVEFDTNLTAEQAMQELVKRGIIKGTPQGLEPERVISRAEFLTLLCGAGAFNNDTESEPAFSDVLPDQWYFTFVQGAAGAGVINGSGDGKFRPNELLNRYQAATIFKNIGGILSEGEETPLDFDGMPEWAKLGCVYAVNTGLISNRADGSFHGFDGVTRIEAAAMVWQYMVGS